jgi:hypothetical protein
MGTKSKPPAAPNPTQSVQAQTGLEQNTAAFNAALNRYNVNTPFGSQTWQQTGTDSTGAPIYTQNISLNPNAQTALNNTQATQAGLSGLQRSALGMINPTGLFDQSQLPKMPINAGTTAQQAIMSRLQPNIDLQNQQFESEMANRGIPVGSDAYNAARRPLMQQQNDQLSQAALYGIDKDMEARQQAIQQQGYYANAPVNYLNALINGSQVQTPQFQGTPSITANAPNYLSAANMGYQGALNGYNAQTGLQNSMLGGLFGLGSAALMSY